MHISVVLLLFFMQISLRSNNNLEDPGLEIVSDSVLYISMNFSNCTAGYRLLSLSCLIFQMDRMLLGSPDLI